MQAAITMGNVRKLAGVRVMDYDEIREWLQKVPTKLLLAEAGRRSNAKRKVYAGGRPKVLRPCLKCGKSFGARELLRHKC